MKSFKFIGGAIIVLAAFAIMLPGFITYALSLGRVFTFVIVTLLAAFAITLIARKGCLSCAKKEKIDLVDFSKDNEDV